MSAPQPTTFASALDHLSTLAPHRVRAIPVIPGQERLDCPAPVQYQFRSHDAAPWGDQIRPALVALLDEHHLTAHTTTRSGRSTTLIQSTRLSAESAPALARHNENALVSLALALVAALTDALTRQDVR